MNEEQKRKIAKHVGFAAAYGMGPERLAPIFIDAQTGAVVAPKPLDLLRSYRTATEKGSRRYPFKIANIEAAKLRARVVQRSFCAQVGREVIRFEPNGDTAFLYCRPA